MTEIKTLNNAKCRWTFKTEACGYLGPEDWCDGTFERCRELGNLQRFPEFYMAQKIIEIRVHQAKISGPFLITIFFNNGTQSLFDGHFKKDYEAEAFVMGLKYAFDWAKLGVVLDEK